MKTTLGKPDAYYRIVDCTDLHIHYYCGCIQGTPIFKEKRSKRYAAIISSDCLTLTLNHLHMLCPDREFTFEEARDIANPHLLRRR